MITKEIRDKIYRELIKLFDTNIATRIEKSIFDFSNDYAETNDSIFLLNQIYNSKSEEILTVIGKNLKYIIDGIKNNTINPNNIAFMKPSELNIEKYADIIKKKEIDNMLSKVKSTNAFECKKCKKSKTTVVEKQIRAGDEPATQFITCLECGHVFTLG